MSARIDSTSCRAQSRSNPDREKKTRVILEGGEGRGAKGRQKERKEERREERKDGDSMQMVREVEEKEGMETGTRLNRRLQCNALNYSSTYMQPVRIHTLSNSFKWQE